MNVIRRARATFRPASKTLVLWSALFLSATAVCCAGTAARADSATGGNTATDQQSFILVENRTDQVVKLSAPGAKPIRIAPESEPQTLQLDRTKPFGVDAKAWWVANPRQLCVIFVRYEGKVVIGGKKDIKCLGN